MCVLYFGLDSARMFRRYDGARVELANISAVLNGAGSVPIAIAEVSVFHRLSFYAPRPLASRLTYVSDPKISVRYLSHDTIDRGLLDLRPWFPLRVVPLNRYVKDNPAFLEFGYIGPWSWLTYVLPQISNHVQMLARDGDRVLLSVEHASVPAGLASEAADPTLPDLFEEYNRSPHSLCERYFSSGHCPVLQRHE